MKKTILSLAIVSSALFASAQIPGISTTAAFDDFMTTEPYTAPSTELGFNDTTKTARTETATKGIFFWTDGAKNDPTTKPDSLDYSWTRGTGSLVLRIDKPYANQQPIGLGFGNYAASASATTSTPFSLDLTDNAVLSITIKSAIDTADANVLFQLKDADGTILYVDKGALALKAGDEPYQYQVGFADNGVGNYAGAKAKLAANNTAVTFTYDFKNALPGAYPQFEADNSSFDYSKVIELAIFFTNAKQNALDGYKPYGLHNTFEITDFKLGDIDSITGVEDNFLSANNNQVVSVYDIMGKFVATGKLKELGLESGKLYVVKSGNKSRKIVMN